MKALNYLLLILSVILPMIFCLIDIAQDPWSECTGEINNSHFPWRPLIFIVSILLQRYGFWKVANDSFKSHVSGECYKKYNKKKEKLSYPTLINRVLGIGCKEYCTVIQRDHVFWRESAGMIDLGCLRVFDPYRSNSPVDILCSYSDSKEESSAYNVTGLVSSEVSYLYTLPFKLSGLLAMGSKISIVLDHSHLYCFNDILWFRVAAFSLILMSTILSAVSVALAVWAWKDVKTANLNMTKSHLETLVRKFVYDEYGFKLNQYMRLENTANWVNKIEGSISVVYYSFGFRYKKPLSDRFKGFRNKFYSNFIKFMDIIEKTKAVPGPVDISFADDLQEGKAVMPILDPYTVELTNEETNMERRYKTYKKVLSSRNSSTLYQHKAKFADTYRAQRKVGSVSEFVQGQIKANMAKKEKSGRKALKHKMRGKLWQVTNETVIHSIKKTWQHNKSLEKRFLNDPGIEINRYCAFKAMLVSLQRFYYFNISHMSATLKLGYPVSRIRQSDRRPKYTDLKFLA